MFNINVRASIYLKIYKDEGRDRLADPQATCHMEKCYILPDKKEL